MFYYIILQYITKLHYGRLLYLIVMIIHLALFLFSFYFHFYSPISFTFTLQILFNIVLHQLFYLVFVLLYLLSLFILRNLLSHKCRVKTNSFIVFSLETYMKTRFNFPVSFTLPFFKGRCFKFYLIAVLICYLYFIIYRRAHALGTMQRCLFWPSLLWVALILARNEAWVVLETLCSLRWCVFGFQSVLCYQFLTFFSPLLF